MKRKFVADAVTAILVGIVLHSTGAPFWFVAYLSIMIFAILAILTIIIDVLDLFGEALDTIILILKSKQK